jgi:hypothetical protein
MTYADFIAQYTLARYQLPGTQQSIANFIGHAQNVADALVEAGYLEESPELKDE